MSTEQQIVCVRRSDDWIAHVKGDTKTWECGKTPEEAVGRLAFRLGTARIERRDVTVKI